MFDYRPIYLAYGCIAFISASSLVYADINKLVLNEQDQKSLQENVSKNNLHLRTGSNKYKANSPSKSKQLSSTQKGRVIVRLSTSGTIKKFNKSLLSTSGSELSVIKSFPLTVEVDALNSTPRHIMVVQGYNKSTKEVIELVKNFPNVELVEADYVVSKNTITPNDPRFVDQWSLENTMQEDGKFDADIDASDAWAKTTGFLSVVVGVIDTGIDYYHPDLIDNMWKNPGETGLDESGERKETNGVDDDGNNYIDDVYGIDTANDDSDPIDDDNHGTHVAGTIGATGNNNQGIVGVNHAVEMAGCKFLTSSGGGYVSDAIECVNYFTALKRSGVNIVATNNSWGGAGYSQALKDSIEAAGREGILFVAAAGNGDLDGNPIDNDSTPQYPSSYDSASIISVASTDRHDNQSSFSNYGLTSVDVAAPGSEILSTIVSATNCIYAPEDTHWNEPFNNVNRWDRFAYYFNDSSQGNNQSLWWQEVSSSTDFWFGIDDSIEGEYQNNLYSAIIYGSTIDLSNTIGNLCLSITIKGENEAYWDKLGVYSTADNGVNWSLLGEIDEAIIPDWKQYSFLVPALFKTTDFKLALVRTSDSSITKAGYLVDDIAIGHNSRILSIADYDIYSGTSMATPHVTGAIALVASQVYNESALERKNRVLDNVDLIPSMNGIIATGGRLNVDKMIPLKKDFNDDSKVDLIWRNSVTGSNVIWHMNDNTKLDSVGFKKANKNWEIVALNDFNGDGKTDLVWRNKNTGSNVIWYMNNNTKIGSVSFKKVSTNWTISGAKDFNYDGKADIVWRNKITGANVIWYMDGSTKLDSSRFSSVNTEWDIVGINDFNGDRKADLVWRNKITGSNVIWYMDNNVKLGSASIRKVSPNWSIVDTDDFNGDGKNDLVWRNKSTGSNVIWYMDNNAKLGSSWLNKASINWEIIGN